MTSKGMNSYDEKQKRSQRRRNHYARDLLTPKYKQRVIESRRDGDDKHWVDWENE